MWCKEMHNKFQNISFLEIWKSIFGNKKNEYWTGTRELWLTLCHRARCWGPLLLVIHINDLEENYQGMIRKFADDIKVSGIVDSEGCQKLQQYLDRLGRWAEEWLMDFDTEKWEALHFGKTNKGRTNTMNGRTLGGVWKQRDLVQIHCLLNVALQVLRVVKNVFWHIGLQWSIDL